MSHHLLFARLFVSGIVVWLALLAPVESAGAAGERAGTVTSVAPLPEKLWPPNAAKAVKLEYVTTNARGEEALSTGQLFLPEGTPPAGGWPVLSWAHGTVGLADQCAPSVAGPAAPDRDFPYLGRWLAEGYALVASDYAGMGTPGLLHYLHGRSVAHNVVDVVKAGRNLEPDLSPRWMVFGQSQGAGAAVYTARYATEFGGPGLDYRGAIATGTPAYIENVVSIGGPKVPLVPLGPGLTAYLSYVVASLRDLHPELGIDKILTATGKKYLDQAEQRCVFDFFTQLRNVNVGDFFTKPLAGLPKWRSTVNAYMRMPERGFDKPLFMGHGALDVDTPYFLAAPYALRLRLNRQPVTFKTYNNLDHHTALSGSLKDTIPFARRQFGSAR